MRTIFNLSFSFVVAIIVSFFICWTPYHAQKLAFIFLTLGDSWTETKLEIFQYSHHIAGVLFYSNCMLNPFLYSLCSHRFRAELKKIWKILTGCICKLYPSLIHVNSDSGAHDSTERKLLAVRYKENGVLNSPNSGTGDITIITITSRKLEQNF